MGEQPTFKMNKKFTDEQKAEIIAYATEHGITSVKAKFNVWPETVRYWIHPELRAKASKEGKVRYEKVRGSDERKEYDKAYRETRKDKLKEYYDKWLDSLSIERKVQRNESIKQHRLDNMEHYKERSNKRYIESKVDNQHRVKYNTDPLHKMKCNIREHIRQAVKYANVSKKHPSIVYLGCTIEEFKAHIENQFVEGMTWDNHSRGEDCWHLDHIKPLALLTSIEDPEEMESFCHYTNYQPLWEKDNLSKNDKYEGP